MLVPFSKYISVAAGSAASDWLTFSALTFVGLNPTYAQGTSRIIGGLFSFGANRQWSFNATGLTSVTVQGRRFILLYCVSYGLSLTSFYFFSNIIEINIFLSKLITDSALFIFNFIVMWLYVFHKRTGFIRWIKLVFQQS